MDKAGAYGIQEVDFVEEIIGDYDNVVGLPSQDVKMALDLLNVLNTPAPVPPYFFPKLQKFLSEKLRRNFLV